MTLHYDNGSPIELADLTISLQAVSRRYVRFAGQQDARIESDDLKLYVKQIRPGSIVVELVDWVASHAQTVGAGAAGLAVGVFKPANTIIDFAKSLRDGLGWLRGTTSKPDDVPTSELRDLARIVEPIAKDSRGSLSISASEGSTVMVSMRIDSLEANAIQNRAEKEIEKRAEPSQKSFQQVVMYWEQASRGATSPSDKAIIDDISEKPLKVLFDKDAQDIKARMISGRDNPFTIAFLVDVDLVTVRGRPVAYMVKRLYEVINDEDEQSGVE